MHTYAAFAVKCTSPSGFPRLGQPATACSGWVLHGRDGGVRSLFFLFMGRVLALFRLWVGWV
jgi:hypothetical protein